MHATKLVNKKIIDTKLIFKTNYARYQISKQKKLLIIFKKYKHLKMRIA